MLFLFRLFSSFIVFCLLWTVLIYSQIGNLTQSTEWIYQVYELKESYAHKIEERKIVISSGSNSLFGINSEELAKFWGIPVVNGGVHAGLGLPYILHKSKVILKKNDIVLLPLEYSLYQMSDEVSEVYLDYILSRDIDYFKNLDIFNKTTALSSLSFSRLVQGIKLNINSTLKPTTGIYGAHNLNKYGDQINNDLSKMTKSQISKNGQIKPKILINTKISEQFIITMDKFIDWARKRNICIITLPPSFMNFDVYSGQEYTSLIRHILSYYNEKKIHFLGDPKDYMFNKSYFFDSRYHLNSSGVKKRTNMMKEDIGQKIENYCKSISKNT